MTMNSMKENKGNKNKLLMSDSGVITFCKNSLEASRSVIHKNPGTKIQDKNLCEEKQRWLSSSGCLLSQLEL